MHRKNIKQTITNPSGQVYRFTKAKEMKEMKNKMMKKIFAAGITAAMILGTTAAVHAETELMFKGKQSASGYLDQDGNEVLVTVDLSDGWSVEFAHGAVYLYDGPNDVGKEAAAVGLTIDEEVYNEQLAIAETQDDYRADDGITAYTEPAGSKNYFFAPGENSYFMIAVSENAEEDADAIMSRISVQSVQDEADESAGSELFKYADISAAMDKVLEEFSTWNGCELTDLWYAGDEASSEQNLEWLNGLKEGAGYTQCMELLMDFHSPSKEEDLKGTAWEPDTEYKDYEWWLARTDGGEWTIVTFGY
jgi:D-alanyl-D-alanine carboxypeptidase